MSTIMASQQSRGQFRGVVTIRTRQDSGEDYIIATCQKCDIRAQDNMQFSGFKLYYCLKCARLSKILYTCFKNGEMDDFDWICSCCKSMFPSLDTSNIATTLQELHRTSDERVHQLMLKCMARTVHSRIYL